MAAIAKAAIYVVALAVIAPFLYDRYVGFVPLLANRAGKFVEFRDSTIKDVRVKFGGDIRNCEDVMLVEDLGIALLSCDEGRDRWNTVMGTFRPDLDVKNGKLYIYDYAQQNPPKGELRAIILKNFEISDSFHPLGIEYDHIASTLYVVNHALSGSRIEVFTVDFPSATATHTQTFKHELLHTPNSIHSLGNGKLYITNDHYFPSAVSPILSKIETFSGLPGGTVTYIDINDPQAARVVARVPFANGIAMLNSTTLAVGSSSKPGVYFFDVESDQSLVFKNVIRAPSSVDNLSVDGSGALLLAGHPDPFRLMHVSKNRWACVVGSDVEEERRACGCIAPSWAGEWTEARGLRTLYKSEGFCSSTTLVRDVERGVGMISGLYSDGILQFSL
ncbi:calcium-dependent phosphotriesterase [Periconia macrospinosa]|uniref:Calcium-dependent phosphotriesterase n=1 Tax=Periconia macrospinosa TaxID=97972 RepID=A0A2V1E7T2_9PLEO|nr:calcium-dependent phosphotriesterase [Periconia macrospinosa]